MIAALVTLVGLTGCSGGADEPTGGVDRDPASVTEDDSAALLALDNQGGLAHHAQLVQNPSSSLEAFETTTPSAR